MKIKIIFKLIIASSIVFVGCKQQKEVSKFIQLDLGHRSAKILEIDSLQFKDLNKNGSLDAYEDWRLPNEDRIKDLISKMSLEEKIGFMLISTTRMNGDYSFQQNAPKVPITSGFNEEDLVMDFNIFSKQPLPNPTMSAAGTTKAVNKFHLRHFILRANTTAKIMADWSNNLQELAENAPLGIPVIVASNPRNHITADDAKGLSLGATVFSKWPGELGLAAMRDLKLTREFAEIAAAEWRAVGLRKGYMYMADLATEPRWQRVEGTFGENADVASDMIREIVLGFQGDSLNNNSVAMTTKHFPGGGPQVDGQDPHFSWGQEQHYPGDMLDYHLKPFQAAIDAGTSAIMPYYSMPVKTEFDSIAFTYNKAIINDLLRNKMGFTGIINSDTGPINMMPWGVEKLTVIERYKKALECGVDLFSGTANPTLLLETVKKGLVSEDRINESISRLLKEKFELGLFENPYVDSAKAEKLVGNPEFQKKADVAMRKSIVLLRNKADILPITKKTKIYFETYHNNPTTLSEEQINSYLRQYPNLEFVTTKETADVILLWLIPNAGSLFATTGAPIDLRLSKNKIDANYVNKLANYKPTIAVINYTSPWIINEIDTEKLHTVIATFGTTQDALLDVINGKFNPTGKMPFTTPISNQAVLENKSDVPGYLKPEGYALFKFGDGISYEKTDKN